MKNYLSKVSCETEWDIMQVAVIGGKMQAVCDMLQDGYQLNLDLLEMLYRLYGTSSVIRAVNASNEDLSDGEHEDVLLFLNETLDEAALKKVMDDNLKKQEFMEEERENAHKEMLEKELSLLIKQYGERSKSFYVELSKFQEAVIRVELMELVVEHYGSQVVCDDLFEHKLLSFVEFSGNIFRPEPRYEAWLKYFDVECLLKIGQLYAAAYMIECGFYYDREDFHEKLFKVANAGGLKYFIASSSVCLYDLFEDESMREKAKELGSIGYQRVHQCAKEYFTLDDWYKWYELDPKAAIKRAHKLKVPRLWLLQHGYIKKAIFRK
ncbi:MAG: hypothetical protein IJ019_00805 [Alphaproteobacteria bacterium]|nr:hypothetical protein [Alphaproteobacteria bacterium]